MSEGFSSYSEFQSVIKRHSSGLQSQVEDMADEIYQIEIADEADTSLWDSFSSEDD